MRERERERERKKERRERRDKASRSLVIKWFQRVSEREREGTPRSKILNCSLAGELLLLFSQRAISKAERWEKTLIAVPSSPGECVLCCVVAAPNFAPSREGLS